MKSGNQFKRPADPVTGAKNREIWAKVKKARKYGHMLVEILPGLSLPTPHAFQLLEMATFQSLEISNSLEYNLGHFIRKALADWLPQLTNPSLVPNARN